MTVAWNKIELNILSVLSDFRPHNQEQIALLIGEDGGKKTGAVHVSRSLNGEKLEPFVKRASTRDFLNAGVDEIREGKYWVMKKDIGVIKNIICKYPDIISSYRVNDGLKRWIAENDRYYMKIQETWSLKPNHWADEFANFGKLEEMFGMSHAFWKNYFGQDFIKFKKLWIEMNQNNIGSLAERLEKDSVGYMYLLFKLFELSIYEDLRGGNENPEAITFYRKHAWFYNVTETPKNKRRIESLPDTIATTAPPPLADRCVINLDRRIKDAART